MSFFSVSVFLFHYPSLSVCLSVCLLVCLSVGLSVCPSLLPVGLPVCLYGCLRAWLIVFFSVCLSIYLSVAPFVFLNRCDYGMLLFSVVNIIYIYIYIIHFIHITCIMIHFLLTLFQYPHHSVSFPTCPWGWRIRFKRLFLRWRECTRRCLLTIRMGWSQATPGSFLTQPVTRNMFLLE